MSREKNRVSQAKTGNPMLNQQEAKADTQLGMVKHVI
jgi:hypothetical protein